MSDQHPDPNAPAPETALQDYVDMMLAPCELDAEVEKQTAAKLREEQARLAEKKHSKATSKVKSRPPSNSRPQTNSHPQTNNRKIQPGQSHPSEGPTTVAPAASLMTGAIAETLPNKSGATTQPLNKRYDMDIPVLGAEIPIEPQRSRHEPVPQRHKKPQAAEAVTKKTQLAEAEKSPTQRQSLDETLVRDRVKQLTERIAPVVPEEAPTIAPGAGSEAEPAPVPDAAAAPQPAVPDASSFEPPSAKQGYPRQTSDENDTATPDTVAAVSDIPDGWGDNGRPVWAEHPFECLLFKLSGLTLAVPLVELGSIYPIHSELTPIFGQADWFLGLFSLKDISIKAVDTAKVIMPERYRPSMQQSLRYIISINGFDWGLAVDEVDKAITLTPDDVRWRTARSKRPWLAGTVVQQMCALLDVRAMAREFEKSSHPSSR